MIALYRLGSNVTVPGIDFGAVQDLQAQAERGGVLGFLNLFSGGALTQMAVFALGIMPYITSSIIMQLLAVVIPKIEQWQKQGAVGQKKITQWTRYMTVGLALLQATGITYQFNNGLLGDGSTTVPLVTKFDVPHVALIVLTITAGTAIVMWMGELITQRGIGNGMSILIFANVVSRMPAQFGNVRAEKGNFVFALFCLVGVGMIAAIVFVEQGQRRIPVQFAKRVVGRRMYGGQSTYIPLKVNQAGVIPIIFASSVLYFPVLLSNVIQVDSIVELHQQEPGPAGQHVLHHDLRPHDRVLHVLLHRDHVQPGPAGRHHPQAGRVHPRHPARARPPSATWPRSSTASPCPAPCSWPPSPSCPTSSCASTTCRASRSGAPRSSSPSAWPWRP